MTTSPPRPVSDERVVRVSAAMLGLALGGYPVLLAGPSQRVVALVIPGVALLALGLAIRRHALGTLGAALLGAAYGVAALTEGVDADLLAPVVGMAWFVLLELLDIAGMWSRGVGPEHGVVLARIRWMVPMALLGGLVGGAALTARLAVGEFGVAATVVGVACILAALAIPVSIALRTAGQGGGRGGAAFRPRR